MKIYFIMKKYFIGPEVGNTFVSLILVSHKDNPLVSWITGNSTARLTPC